MKIELDEETYNQLKKFKDVFDAIMGKKLSSSEYVNMVVSAGLDQMLRDTVPEGTEWTTIKSMFEKNPEFVCKFLAGVWKEIKKDERKETREKLRLKYIG